MTGTTPNQEKKQPERGWLGDKVGIRASHFWQSFNSADAALQLNEMAGGGKKGEADEGQSPLC